MSKMKEQNKSPEKQLNEVEIDNPLEKELRIMTVTTVQDLRKRMEKMQEMFTKDLEELKNKQIEMNNTLQIINNRVTKAEEWTSDSEDKMVEITAAKQKIEKRMKIKEGSLRDPWNNIKGTNFCMVGMLEGEREKGPKKIFEEIIAENFPNMGKEIVNQVQGAQRIPGRRNPRRTHSNQTDKN